MSVRSGNVYPRARVAGVTLAVGLAAVGLAAVAPATPGFAARAATTAASATTRATDEDKVNAARVLGLNPGISMLVLNDREFVLALWREALDESYVKTEALKAYTSPDPEAAYLFITTGIFNAADDDAQAEIEAARAKALRRACAVRVGLDPADTVLIEKSNRDFIFSVWQRVRVGSHVWTAAKDALKDGSTEQDWVNFITTGAQAAAEQDMTDAIAAADQQLAQRLLAEQLATAKRALLQLLQLPVTDEVVNSPNRQFVLTILNNARGPQVRIAAQAALNAPEPALAQTLRDFIVTGGVAANTRDEQAAAALQLADYRNKVSDILDAARRDGFQPKLVAAAEEALNQSTLTGLQAFLLDGQYRAAERDRATPAENLVIELKGLQSGRCLQVAGLWGYGAESNGAGTELWDCVSGNKQRWVLHDKGNSTFSLENVNSQKCLAVTGTGNDEALAQYDCAAVDGQLWKFVDIADSGLVELRNIRSGKVATASASGTENGTAVAQTTNTHASNQAWRLIDVNHTGSTNAMQPGIVELAGVPSGRCLQVAGLWDTPDQGANGDGAGMELWDCVHGNKMRWGLVDAGDHKYALKNIHSGKCLDLQGTKAGDATPLIQLTCRTTASQQWLFLTGRNNATKLVNVRTGGLATVANAGTANASLIQQFTDFNGDQQHWQISVFPLP